MRFLERQLAAPRPWCSLHGALICRANEPPAALFSGVTAGAMTPERLSVYPVDYDAEIWLQSVCIS